MKKTMTILLAAFLILLLGWVILPAPAREQEAPPEEDIAGSDWRTWGIIDDSGTLVQDGDTIPFCACVHTENTTLYHDTENQVLLAELDYPAPVENAEQRYLGMDSGSALRCPRCRRPRKGLRYRRPPSTDRYTRCPNQSRKRRPPDPSGHTG